LFESSLAIFLSSIAVESSVPSNAVAVDSLIILLSSTYQYR
jgi:hypothetical protein